MSEAIGCMVLLLLLGVVWALAVALRAKSEAEAAIRELGQVRLALRELERRLRQTTPAPPEVSPPPGVSPSPEVPRRAATPPPPPLMARREPLRPVARPAAAMSRPAPAGAPAKPAAPEPPDADDRAELGPADEIPEAPESAPSLEERLGARLFVWIAGVALFLAGAYLVKYSFEQRLLSPAVRVSLGGLMGLALVFAGQWVHPRSLRIGAALTAAGIAVLFAVLLAALHVEHLIAPLVGFVLMAVVAAAAVLLSLRQGPYVALLGLLGGFATPALVGPMEHAPGQLFGYLLVVELGLVALTRVRRWWWLTMLTVFAGYAWVVAWMALWYREGDGLWLGLFLLASVAVFVVGAGGKEEEGPGPLAPEIGSTPLSSLDVRQWRAVVRWSGAALGLLLLSVLVHVAAFTWMEWTFLGILGAGLLAVGRLDRRCQSLPWLGAAASALLLLSWIGGRDEPDQVLLARVVAGLGALYAAGGYVCLWGSRRPGAWAMLSGGVAVAFTLLAYWGIEPVPFPRFWGALCMVLAALYALGAMPLLYRRAQVLDVEEALAALFLASAAFVALAVPIELERQWITVAWAALVPAALLLERWLRVPALRVVAAVLAGAVMVRLLFNPFVLHYPPGDWIVLNWLLYGYGIPIAAFAAGAWLLRRAPDQSRESLAVPLATALEAGALALGVAMLTLQVRHGFHRPGLGFDRDFLPAAAGFVEVATYGILWLTMAAALLATLRWWPRLAPRYGAYILAVLGAGATVLLLGLTHNPLWRALDVGPWPVVNWLLYGYGVPALLALLLGWQFKREGQAQLAQFVPAFSLVLLFVLVSLEVRQGFHGRFLHQGEVANSEMYAYSAAWVLFSGLLLLLGIVLRNTPLRLASMVIMLVAVAKVFLWDMAHLRDLYRVASFLGLGLSLLVVAWVYQRFVFHRAR